jgi:PKHD-type hydroxylase
LSPPDAYTGGELQIRFDEHTVTAPRSRGSLVVLPTWTIHKVCTVTGGERWTLIVYGSVAGGARNTPDERY